MPSRLREAQFEAGDNCPISGLTFSISPRTVGGIELEGLHLIIMQSELGKIRWLELLLKQKAVDL